MSRPLPDPARWQRIESLLHRALELDAEARAKLLGRECGDDDALRAEVESLIAASAADCAALSDGIALAESMPRPPPRELPAGTRLGPWQITALIGRGGMGEVYRGQRADGQFEQAVAIKVLRPEAAQQLPRFEAERRILARLVHPGIARLLDSGITDDGRPAMVMEFIEGAPLLEHCHRAAAGLAARLHLFGQVLEAVGFAHANLVIHRDLKPGNILVTRDGQVKLLDFGVAKLLDPAAWGEDAQTRTQIAPLTPAYAAPEQLRGEAVTTASDVYSLGAVLYELLAEAPPWTLQGTAIAPALQRLLTGDPPLASSRAVTGAPVSAAELRGDLDAILGHCLRKSPRERYTTIAALQADLDRHRAGLPVAARPADWRYRSRKFLRRNRLPLAAAGTVLLLCAGFFWRLALERDRAQAEAARATSVSQFLEDDLLGAADPFNAAGGGSDIPALLQRASARLATRFENQPALRASVALTLARAWRGQALYPQGIADTLPLLADAEQALGADAPATMRLRNALGELQRLAGQLDAAEATHRRELELAADRSAEAFAARAGLAAVMFERGQNANAAAAYEALLAEAQSRDDLDPLLLADLRWHRASLDLDAGRLDRAETTARELVAFHTDRFGAHHANTRWMRTTLGQVLLARGQADDAASLFEAVRAEAEQELGADHPNTTSAAYLLARARLAQHRTADAVALLRELLARRSRVHGESHAWTLLVRHRLGEALLRDHRPDEALPLLQRAYQEGLARYGADSDFCVEAGANLAQALASRRR